MLTGALTILSPTGMSASSLVTHGVFFPWNSPARSRFTFIPSFETAFRLPGDISLMISQHKIKIEVFDINEKNVILSLI